MSNAMSPYIEDLFVEQPKPFSAPRDHLMEVLVGGLDGQIYEVEKGHHLNWVRKHLRILDKTVEHELAKKALGNEKDLPEEFYNLFPNFVRILVIEKPDRSNDTLAYFESKAKTPELRKTVLKIMKMFKQVTTIQVYLHDSRELLNYSRREYVIGG
jgi:hypothetical protein